MIRIILPIFLLSASLACAQLIVDPGPGVESLRSKIYQVSVKGNGGEGDSYVYQSDNNADFKMFPPGTFMATANHWTSFCFDGTATVRIRKLDGSSPRSVRIRPASAGIQAEIIGHEVVFKLDRPRQLSVEIDAPDELIPQPLLIFANPPEKNPPSPAESWNYAEKGLPSADRKKPLVLHFPRGVHNLVRTEGVPLNPGFRLRSGDKVHLAHGAYVIGAFRSTSDARNIRISGRGTLSALGEPFVKTKYRPLKPDADIEFSYSRCGEHLVQLQGRDHHVEGIVFTDPAHFCINISDASRVENIKCFGWHYSTDGIGIGSDTVLRDSFFKCNDDSIKLYNDGIDVANCVIWQQFNGAAFQFSWGHGGVKKGFTVRDIDIIHDEHRRDANNRGLFSCVKLEKPMRGMLFENIRVEGDSFRLIDLRVHQGGSISDLTLRNVSVQGRILDANYLRARGGSFGNLVIQGLRIGGTSVTAESMKLVTEGEVPPPNFKP
ncbi:MAG: hypothetical protein MUF13_14190 [Akkermansiaceae bacterium]|jgi:hypothetical protein|nr:hypothetical protein [Akkermansiaceae bacterium]